MQFNEIEFLSDTAEQVRELQAHTPSRLNDRARLEVQYWLSLIVTHGSTIPAQTDSMEKNRAAAYALSCILLCQEFLASTASTPAEMTELIDFNEELQTLDMSIRTQFPRAGGPLVAEGTLFHKSADQQVRRDAALNDRNFKSYMASLSGPRA